MLVNELIEKLQSFQREHGDVEVIIWEDDICQHRGIDDVTYSLTEKSIIINDC